MPSRILVPLALMVATLGTSFVGIRGDLREIPFEHRDTRPIPGDSMTVVCVGDSLTKGGETVAAMRDALRSAMPGRRVNVINAGVNGSRSGQWTAGSLNLERALSLVSGRKNVLFSVCLGTNDCNEKSLVPPEEFARNLNSISARISEAGHRSIFHSPPHPTEGAYGIYSPASIARLRSYLPAIAAQSAQGDREAFAFFAGHPGLLPDGLHPTKPGCLALGVMWAASITSQ